jgi:hypothetical protein
MTLPNLADLVMTDPPAIAEYDDVPPVAGTAPVKGTIRRMAETVRTGKPPKPSAADINAAFDGGPARLTFDDEPLFPKNPIPSGSRTRKGGGTSAVRAARPAGASDLQPLFATGMLLLATFLLDESLAPTEPEAQAIAAPLANILARRIDLAAKMGADASDTIALAVAFMSYGARIAPAAMERARDGYKQYNRRQRVDRVGRPPTPPNDRAADGVAPWADDRTGTGPGAFDHPVDAIAKARRAGWGTVERDLGPSANGVDPMGS